MVSPPSEFAPLSEESGAVLSSVEGLVSAGALIVVVVMSLLFPPAVPVPVPASGLSPLHAVRDRSIIAVVVIIKAFFIFDSPYFFIYLFHIRIICFLFVIIPFYFEKLHFLFWKN